MTSKENLLIEIGTEELPPKNLSKLMSAFSNNIEKVLKAANFEFTDVKAYATPRRLAVIVAELNSEQPAQQVEKRGPALAAAVDDNGEPTKAAQGFMRSCGVTSLDELDRMETEKGTWLVHRSTKAGESLSTQISNLLQQSLKDLPIERRMRWGASRFEFVRPVHWLVVLHGDEVLPCQMLGVNSGRTSRGHRFMSEGEFDIPSANEYVASLKAQHVIVDFSERTNLIEQQLKQIANEQSAEIEIDSALLDEVTALVEWPVALMGSFPDEFLKVPEEALISAMKEHQRYFHMLDGSGNMLAKFITISNIESRNPQVVIAGNEKVILPRLSDARFFVEQDQKSGLQEKRNALGNVVFQSELGTYLDKTKRVETIADFLATTLGANVETATRAASLCKADLVSDMVGEFPDLQGIMGGYYATYEGESEAVAQAISQHYLPDSSGGNIPESLEAKCVAIADKLDTLVGMFGIGQPPTGSKDPFALRRQTLGIVRMCVEGKLDIPFAEMINQAISAHGQDFQAKPILDYTIDRLKNWYQDRGVRFDTVDAVVSIPDWHSNLHKTNETITALEKFRDTEQAVSLVAANKRVANILKKQTDIESFEVDPTLFVEEEESSLFDAVEVVESSIDDQNDDTAKLEQLGTLRDQVDQYFEKVMVMADDEMLQKNRIATLSKLRNLFLRVADISLLQQ